MRTYVMSRKNSVPSMSGMASAWQVTELATWSPRETVTHLSPPSSLLSSATRQELETEAQGPSLGSACPLPSPYPVTQQPLWGGPSALPPVSRP